MDWLKLSISLVSLVVFGTAQASYITIEPDDFAAGTNVSNVAQGISLSAVTATKDSNGVPQYETFGAVYATDFTSIGTAATGTQVFSASPTHATFWESPNPEDLYNRYPSTALRVDFDFAVNLVDFLWVDIECTQQSSGIACGDYAHLWVFDSNDQLLQECVYTDVAAPGCGLQSLGLVDNHTGAWSTSYYSASANIAYAIIGDGIHVDRLTVGAPEPDTLVLFAIGLVGAGVARHRKKTAH